MIVRSILGLMVITYSLSVFSAAPISQFRVQVADENGMPVEGAIVQGYFANLEYGYLLGPETKGISDIKGVAEVSGPAYFSVNVEVYKEGYYKSKKNIPVNINKNQNISFLLRPKQNPVEMYAKHFKGYIPKNKTIIAFDFLKGDWVQPYGKGLNEDVYFFYDGYSKSFFDYGGKLTVSFPNEFDGLIDLEYQNGYYSELKLPYMAPKNGYRKAKTLIHKRRGKGASAVIKNNLNKKNNFGYFLRIQSKTDSSGKILQANYVKISGEIIIDPRSEGNGVAYLEMTYYYNPTINDRNMEFDPNNNLFKNLTSEEQVIAP
jgi:hypothetical protein